MPDTYIEECIKQRHKVVVFTINGFQIRGVIFHEEEEYIIVDVCGKKQMVYKHAISTISPA